MTGKTPCGTRFLSRLVWTRRLYKAQTRGCGAASSSNRCRLRPGIGYSVCVQHSGMILGSVLGSAALAGLLSGCKVFSVRADADAAVAAWAQRSGETDPCRFDAMQHCVGASGVAASYGPDWAVFLGQLWEFQQDDGDPMDLHNNEAGADCARAITSEPSGAVSCCENMLDAEPPLLRTDGRCE